MEEVVGSIPTRCTKISFARMRAERVPACREGRRFDPDQVHQFLLDALHLHPPKRENQKVLYWLRVRSACSINRAPARADDFNAWPGAVGFGVSGTVRHISRGATPRAAAKKLEIASFDSGIDRSLEQETLSASRPAGKVVCSIPTRSTNRSTT